jgi:hypothetical protein
MDFENTKFLYQEMPNTVMHELFFGRITSKILQNICLAPCRKLRCESSNISAFPKEKRIFESAKNTVLTDGKF